MIRLAFTGNPNVGKSALINAIAGSKLIFQHLDFL